MSINTLAVIGAGTMGHGIAQVFAQAGLQVALTDKDAHVLYKARQRVQVNLEAVCRHNPASGDGGRVASALARITTTSDLAEAVSQAEFVIEAVIEELDVKRVVLRQLEEHCPANTIITSTTSSYRVRDLGIALDHPERFLVTHFWNPPYVIPAVEVMPGDLTSMEAIQTTLALLGRAGKIPVVVKKDVAGFIGNRLQHALRREAIAIVAQGIASAQDVDLVARLSFGLRMPIVGPLETVDLGGLDLTQAIQAYLLPKLDRSTEPAQLLKEKVAAGELGAKAGKGFYDWSPETLSRTIEQRDVVLLQMVEWLADRGYVEGTEM